MDDMIERRKLVADSLDMVIQVARSNGIGPISFSDLMMSVAGALYRAEGRSKDNFLTMAGKFYDNAKTNGPVKH
jgi:hypothetical protein